MDSQEILESVVNRTYDPSLEILVVIEAMAQIILDLQYRITILEAENTPYE